MKPTSHDDQVRTNRSESVGVCDAQLVIFMAKSCKKTEIVHRPTVRNPFGARPASPFHTAWHLALLHDLALISHDDQPFGIGRCVRYASCAFSDQELQKPTSHDDQPFGIRSVHGLVSRGQTISGCIAHIVRFHERCCDKQTPREKTNVPTPLGTTGGRRRRPGLGSRVRRSMVGDALLLRHAESARGHDRTASVMCDMHLVIFLAKKYKPEYRTSTHRTASVMCDMHLVIFLAKKYKTEYRTSTSRVPLLPICWTISISNISTKA